MIRGSMTFYLWTINWHKNTEACFDYHCSIDSFSQVLFSTFYSFNHWCISKYISCFFGLNFNSSNIAFTYVLSLLMEEEFSRVHFQIWRWLMTYLDLWDSKQRLIWQDQYAELNLGRRPYVAWLDRSGIEASILFVCSNCHGYILLSSH